MRMTSNGSVGSSYRRPQPGNEARAISTASCPFRAIVTSAPAFSSTNESNR